MTLSQDDIECWTPLRIIWQGNEPAIAWQRLGRISHSAPFFANSIGQAQSCLRKSPEQRITLLAELSTPEIDTPPDGFIFHLSRCGSTLVSQLLSKLNNSTVIAEASPVDSILRAHLHDPSVTDQQRIAWLRAILSALRLNSVGRERFFVKFDAWNTLDIHLIQCAFPSVPWIFLCRDTDAVLSSHARMPGSHMVNGNIEPGNYGWNHETVANMPMTDYSAAVLSKICNTAHHAALGNPNARVIDYSQLPDAVLDTILPFFKINTTQDEIQRIEIASRVDAKSGGTIFSPVEKLLSPSPSPAIHQSLRNSYAGLLAQALHRHDVAHCSA